MLRKRQTDWSLSFFSGSGSLRQGRRWVVVLVLLGFCAVLQALAWSAHVPQLQWMAPYRSADGSACCDITDCLRAEVTLLSTPTDEMVRVLVSWLEGHDHRQHTVNTVVVVPRNSIHRSEDAHGWYCTKAHVESWNTLGESTNLACVTTTGYRVIGMCVRCIFVGVGV